MEQDSDYEARFSRQTALPGFGREGQDRLRRGAALVIGAGGLGSPAILYLAAAGVGRIGIADGDCVDVSNLQRQVIHGTSDLGEPKAASAARKARDINPGAEIVEMPEFITAANIRRAIAPYDFVLDCTDSMAAKFMVNDACVGAGKPYCHGAIGQYRGQLMTVAPGTACLRCLFPDQPEQPAGQPAGPLGAVAGVIGTLQAAEAVKWLARVGEPLTGALLAFDALTMQFTRFEVPRCGHPHGITELIP